MPGARDAAPPCITGLGSPNPKVEQQPPVTNHNFVSEDNQWKLNLTKDFIALSTLHYPGWEVCPPAGQAAGRLYPAVQARLFPAGGPAVCEHLLPCPAGAGGARWAELFSPACTAPMQEAELPEDRFLNCACDLTLKLDSSCQAKVHAGPGVVKRNAPGVPQDPEVKFIFDMDLSMTGNTPLHPGRRCAGDAPRPLHPPV